MDWWATVHGVTEESDTTEHAHTHVAKLSVRLQSVREESVVLSSVLDDS